VHHIEQTQLLSATVGISSILIIYIWGQKKEVPKFIKNEGKLKLGIGLALLKQD